MSPEEAAWLAGRLAGFAASELSPLVNLGSSTAQFREVLHPHIDRLLIAPLIARGVTVRHVDLARAPGVDIAGDICQGEIQALLRAIKPRAILCCNLLEHVSDPRAVASACDRLLDPGGLLFVSAPHRYPYHPDPIDTGWRPAPEDLAGLWPGYDIIDRALLSWGSYGRQLRAKRWLLLRDAYLLVAGVGRPARWRVLAGNYRHLRAAYETSCVVLRSGPSPSAAQ